MSTNTWFVDVIYCDDVRREDTGKGIYIGVYNGSMVTSQIPAILPKFVIITKVFRPSDSDVLPSEITLRSDQAKVANFPIPTELTGDDPSSLTIEMHSTNFQVTKEATLDVEVQIDGMDPIYSRPFFIRHMDAPPEGLALPFT